MNSVLFIIINLAWRLFSGINEMSECQNGVLPDHLRAGVAHNIPYFLLHILFVTVNRTIFTGCLLIVKWTFGESLLRIFQ